MGPFEAQVLSTAFGVVGGVTALGMILRFMIRRKELEAGRADPEVTGALESLRDEVNDLRAHLGEVHERLDFAERLLADGRRSPPEEQVS